MKGIAVSLGVVAALIIGCAEPEPDRTNWGDCKPTPNGKIICA